MNLVVSLLWLELVISPEAEGGSLRGEVATLINGEAKADPYHSSNQGEILRKIRLLGSPDLDNPSDKGGIRHRTYDEINAVTDLGDPFNTVRAGSKAVSKGSKHVTQYFDFVSKAFENGRKSLNQMEDFVENTKARLDKEIGNFGTNWEGDMMKKVKQDPDTYNNVFGKFNQAAISEYHSLMQLIRSANTSFYTSGRSQTASDASHMKAENKTLNTIAKLLKLGTSEFAGMLNRRVLPLLAGTKFGAGASVPVLQKQVADSLDELENDLLPDLSNQALQYMQTNAEDMGNSTARLIATAAKSLTKQLSSMRAALNRQGQRTTASLSKNFTQISNSIKSANATVAKHNSGSIAKLQGMADTATSTTSKFATQIASTSSDLTDTLNSANTALSSIESSSNLGSQEVLSNAGDELNGLLSNLKKKISSASSSQSVNNLQASIGSVYSAGTSANSANLQGSIQPRIDAALRDAGDSSSDLSDEFKAVSSQTQDLVSNTLQTGASVANANLEQLQRQATASAKSIADETMASVDTNAAESDADRADVLGKFQQGMDAKNSEVSGRFDDVRNSISQKSSSISQSAIAGISQIAKSISTSQDMLENEDGSVTDLNSLLVNLTHGALPQLDSDNENRMQSLLADLNSMRRQASSEGGNFQADSTRYISSLISQASKNVSGIWSSSQSMQKLNQQTMNLKSSAAGYSSILSGFQGNMSNQMSQVDALYNALGGDDSSSGPIIGQEQDRLRNAAAPWLRQISNWTNGDNSISNYLASDPRVNVANFLGKAVDKSRWRDLMQTLDNQMNDLNQKRSSTKQGISQFQDFLSQLEAKIRTKLVTDASDPDRIQSALNTRDSAVAEITSAETEMNRSISSHIQAANESISNKTFNFYKQFQTASLIADSLVTGFTDYITRLVAVENASEATRQVTQANLVKAIRTHLASAPPPVNVTNATQLARVQALVSQAMDSSNTSQAAIAQRKAAEDALVAEYGIGVARKLQDQYSMLQTNAKAFALDIEASQSTSVDDRATSVDASRMGVEGIIGKANLFQGAASGVVNASIENAQAISDKIDSLLDGGSFLTNITGSELAAILESVQNSDQMYHSNLNEFKDSSLDQVATLGGVVADFANLVSTELNRTNAFLKQLSANYTLLVKQTDAVTIDPINSIKANYTSIHDQVSTSNASLGQHLLSIGPIEEGLQERIESLSDRQDAYANSIHEELSDLANSINQLDGQVAVSRNAGMGKLRDALASLKDDFREQALQFQSMKTGSSSSLIQTQSDSEIRSDMNNRIFALKAFLRGNTSD